MKVTDNRFGEEVVTDIDNVTFYIKHISDCHVTIDYISDYDIVTFSNYGKFTIDVGYSEYIKVFVDNIYWKTYIERLDYEAGTTFTILIPRDRLEKDTVHSSSVYISHVLKVENYVSNEKVSSDIKFFYVLWNYATLKIKVIVIAPNSEIGGTYDYYLKSDDNAISTSVRLSSVDGIYKPSNPLFEVTYYNYERDSEVRIDLHGPEKKHIFWVFYQIITDTVIASAYISVGSSITYDFITDSIPDDSFVYSTSNLNGFLKLESPSWCPPYSWGFKSNSWSNYGSTIWIAIELTNLNL